MEAKGTFSKPPLERGKRLSPEAVEESRLQEETAPVSTSTTRGNSLGGIVFEEKSDDSFDSPRQFTIAEEKSDDFNGSVAQKEQQYANYIKKRNKILSKKEKYEKRGDKASLECISQALSCLNGAYEAMKITHLVSKGMKNLLEDQAAVYESIASDYMDAVETTSKPRPYIEAADIQERVILLIEEKMQLLRAQEEDDSEVFESNYFKNQERLEKIQLSIEEHLKVAKRIRRNEIFFSTLNFDYSGPRFFELP